MNAINDAIVSLLAGDVIDSDSLRSFLDANPELGIIILNLISDSIDAGKPTPTLADVAAFLGESGLTEEGLFFSGLFDVDAGFPLDDGPALGDRAKFLGLTDSNELVIFSADAPENVSKVKVDGIDGTLLGIDVRSSDGKIYGLTTANKIYTLAPAAVGSSSYSATLVSTLSIPFAGGTINGFDFNPAADRLRLVGDNDQNFRINVDTGAVLVDSALAFAGNDLNGGINPNITAAAYTNAFAGSTSTQLYNIDTLLDQLVLQNPPNNGTLMTIGDLGVDFDTLGGFDILSDGMGGNAAFAVSNGQLYSIDLEKGTATSLGRVGDNAQLNIQGLVVMAATPDDGSMNGGGMGREDNPDGLDLNGNMTDAKQLFGTAAAESLTGGAGNDLLYGNGGGDILMGNGGNDQLYGSLERDRLTGGSSDDLLYGNGGSDQFAGDAGHDSLFGGAQSDAMMGGSGDDLLYGNGGGDRLWGDGGHDRLYGSNAQDQLMGGSGDDILYGNGGDDLLVGGSGHDLIYGGSGADTILGGDGNDVIYSNGGADVIDSGAGMDEIWLGGSGHVSIQLNRGEGFAAIKNFQQGNTQLKFSGSVDYQDSADGVRISTGGDLLAVVAWNTVSQVQGSLFA